MFQFLIRTTVELVQSDTWVSDILWHPTKIDGPKVVLLTKIKPEYSDIMSNPAHFPGPLVCRIIQVLLYVKTNSKIWFEPVNSIF